MFISEESLFVFVSTGKLQKMFTLRVMERGYEYIGRDKIPQKTSYFVKTLGTDLTESIEKAKRYAKENAIPFKDECGLTISKISRRSAQEIQAEKDEARAKNEILIAHKEALKINADMDLRNHHFDLFSTVHFGKFAGRMTVAKLIAEHFPYLQFLIFGMEAKDTLTELKTDLLRTPAQAQLLWFLESVSPWLPPLPKNKSNYVGTIGEKMEFTATVKNVLHFDSEFGIVFIYLMEDENGNVLSIKYSGSKFYLRRNVTYKFQAKVKDHQLYEPKGDLGLPAIKQTQLFYLSKVVEIE